MQPVGTHVEPVIGLQVLALAPKQSCGQPLGEFVRVDIGSHVHNPRQLRAVDCPTVAEELRDNRLGPECSSIPERRHLYRSGPSAVAREDPVDHARLAVVIVRSHLHSQYTPDDLEREALLWPHD